MTATVSHHFGEWARAVLAHRSPLGRWHRDASEAHEVFQTSTIDALMAGAYDGDLTVGELLEHGDFGVGTFDRLDGEMVVLDGTCYRLRADGSAEVVGHEEHTPFAAVTRFVPDATTHLIGPTDREALCRRFDSLTDDGSLIYAVRATGRFAWLRMRTVLRQSRPYPPLLEATAHEPITELTDTEATLVGFRTPDYAQGISVAGYHLHVLDATRTRGGHVLDLVLDHGELAVSTGSELHLHLPATSSVLAPTDPATRDADIRRAEGDQHREDQTT
jgi:acetolactate decarboxylase